MSPFELGQLVTTALSLGVTAFAVWVAHKSRQAPLHEALYARQVEAALDMGGLAHQLQVAVRDWLFSPTEDAARRVSERWLALEESAQKWEAVTPPPVFDAFTNLVHEWRRLFSREEYPPIVPADTEVAFRDFVLARAGLAVAWRDAIGVADLSRQSAHFFRGERESVELPAFKKEVLAKYPRRAGGV